MDTVKSLQEYRNDSEIIWYIRQLCKQSGTFILKKHKIQFTFVLTVTHEP